MTPELNASIVDALFGSDPIRAAASESTVQFSIAMNADVSMADGNSNTQQITQLMRPVHGCYIPLSPNLIVTLTPRT